MVYILFVIPLSHKIKNSKNWKMEESPGFELRTSSSTAKVFDALDLLTIFPIFWYRLYAPYSWSPKICQLKIASQKLSRKCFWIRPNFDWRRVLTKTKFCPKLSLVLFRLSQSGAQTVVSIDLFLLSKSCFSSNGVYKCLLLLSICEVIVSRKSSNGEGK